MRYGIREICNISLKAKANQKIGSHVFQKDEPVIKFESAKTSSMETASTTVYASGGRGNNRLIAWEGEKTLTFTFEEALISQEGLAILTGADLLDAGTAGTIKAHTTETTKFLVGGQADFAWTGEENVVEEGCSIYAMLLDDNGEMSGIPVKIPHKDTIQTQPLYWEFVGPQHAIFDTSGTLFKAGDSVLLDYYVEHSSDASQIDITPDQFAGFYYLEADTLFRREKDGVDLPAVLTLPKVKIQSNFTFTMASSGDPSTFTFTLDAFPDYTKFGKNKKVLASLQLLGADDNYDNSSQVVTEEKGILRRYNYNYNNDGNYIAKIKKTPDDWYTVPYQSIGVDSRGGYIGFTPNEQYITNDEIFEMIPFKTKMDLDYYYNGTKNTANNVLVTNKAAGAYRFLYFDKNNLVAETGLTAGSCFKVKNKSLEDNKLTLPLDGQSYNKISDNIDFITILINSGADSSGKTITISVEDLNGMEYSVSYDPYTTSGLRKGVMLDIAPLDGTNPVARGLTYQQAYGLVSSNIISGGHTSGNEAKVLELLKSGEYNQFSISASSGITFGEATIYYK